MKRIFGILLLPIIAIMCLCGCKGDKTSADVKSLYESTIQVGVIDDENKFFSDPIRPNTICIAYSEAVKREIEATSPSTDLQKKYTVIGYQQKLLDNIYNYYENNRETFYREMSSKKINKDEMEAFYTSLEQLNSELNSFRTSYEEFCDAAQRADIMEFQLDYYSYSLNRLIDKSFAFMYNFINLNIKYCIKDYDLINTTNLQLKVQKSYVDIAYIIYLTNFKAFDYSVGSKGISDMSVIVGNSNEFVIQKDLQTIKTISNEIMAGLEPENINHENAVNLVNDYLYSLDVFYQRLGGFLSIYNSANIYTISQYKFGLVAGVDYDSYLSSLTKSEQTAILFMDGFVSDTYSKLVDTMSLIVA